MSFNAAFGPGICTDVGQEFITVDEFLAALEPVEHTGEGHWRYTRSEVTIRAGGTIRVNNRGGEDHSFAEVPFVGGGCIDGLNAGLGLTKIPRLVCPGPDPGNPAGLQPPNGSKDFTGLAPGQHTFMCIIHPWMNATVTVRT